MSWFNLGDQPRRYQKGVWLRPRSLPENIREAIDASRLPHERLDRVVICERHKDDATLEVWLFDTRTSIDDPRYGVVYVVVPVQDDWCCEGDLGRGYKGPGWK